MNTDGVKELRHITYKNQDTLIDQSLILIEQLAHNIWLLILLNKNSYIYCFKVLLLNLITKMKKKL